MTRKTISTTAVRPTTDNITEFSKKLNIEESVFSYYINIMCAKIALPDDTISLAVIKLVIAKLISKSNSVLSVSKLSVRY